ncbi:MAG: type VI secretion system-associated FHA domain protein TagH [Candidatus Thiodiazotropha lotti]|uniref:Type VI secretion system-associated FHA domain protein TagH n=1 Tax=Candidatus Thiodiazotropha lotti TaxID=2792787 RepID=A0A9E4K246_9GAMM|nr:type VI secretion system-associated FHA domain protein TagH [Candidatus Thiodiazotropha lotti]MCG7929122.1 type VI secretion system-associated FHA domain protein TagH [Candidatus Thiodiazotropha lotti]MCG7937331.1 type VI secretion system-associated FHA domain protein TagH [Candidatus Thiodiazotropha lotti]MCG7986373.1 type VI secretion system-associated FHA domain protein TagH [Candidatus Thiodiazotropha lotti]MCG8009177.1 type VI secretion system-associated FHA domain protein TagH [Candida
MYSDSNSATITLTVSLKAGSAPAQPMSTTFDQQGGSIGRRDENDWVLPDPERFISGRHALIFYSENAFHLTDTSSNGVFINRSATALGKDNVIKLEDGDTIGVGDYEITVSLPKPETLAAEDFDNLDDPFAQMSEQLAGEPETVETPHVDAPADLDQPAEEPVYTLDEPDPSELVVEQPSDELSPAPLSQTDHTSDLNAFFNQPTPIPEDWDLDETPAGAIPADEPIPSPEILPPLDDQPVSQAPFPDSQPVVKEEPAAPALSQESIPRPGLKAKQPVQQSSPPQSAPQSSPPPAPQPVTATAGTTSDDAGLRRALAEGLGIPETYLEGISLADLLSNLGSAMRANVEGTMSILRARAQMKGEFRMSQTMIQPVENNPLKFSINTEEALRHLVNPSQKSGYLPPLNAIEEAHEDIEAHMLAVMVGMQAALQVVLQRFKPEILEKRLGQSALLEKLPLYRHAKTWDLFTELYSEIAVEAEDDFHQLFGRTFSQAYEEQIRRLEALKHTDPHLDKRF